MKFILFLLYYCKLQLSVMLGFHQTVTPLDLKWRWEYWKSKYQRGQTHRL